MKHFVDENGTFEIQVPENWKYTLFDSKVHTFQNYQFERKVDKFQLSIEETSHQKYNKKYKSLNKSKKNKIFDDNKFYDLTVPLDDLAHMVICTMLIKNKSILFTYLFDIDENVLDIKKFIQEKKSLINDIIHSFKLIKPEYSVSVYESYLFGNFINGVGASNYLLNNAIVNRSFIEATCLLANLIDALLRIGIVLKLQLINKNTRIERKWIFQGVHDKIITERQVYSKAKEIGIVNESLYTEMSLLYENRNKVVHRFIISELNIADVEDIDKEYYFLFLKIKSIINELEDEQIITKTGMTIQSDNEDINYLDLIKSKIVNMDISKL